MSHIPKLGESKPELALARCGDQVLIKFENFSYYHVSWESISLVLSHAHRSFEAKIANALELDDPVSDLDALVDLGAFPETVLQPEKVLTFRVVDRKTRLWLVKWSGLKISHSSWELERLKLLPRFALTISDLVDDFYSRNSNPSIIRPLQDTTKNLSSQSNSSGQTSPDLKPLIHSTTTLGTTTLATTQDLATLFVSTHIGTDGQSHLRSDGSLYAYQVQSVAWMLRNLEASRSCILAICMGAGKTVMSAVLLEFLFSLPTQGGQGPALVVAPLSTLPNWKRELDKWTSLRTVVFQGDKEDRELIKNYELSRVDLDTGLPIKRSSSSKISRVTDIILISYETLTSQVGLLKQFRYSVGILDEAHRLKSETSLARQSLLELEIDWKVMLTGTPVQNNLKELWSLLNVLDPVKFNSYDIFESSIMTSSADVVVNGVDSVVVNGVDNLKIDKNRYNKITSSYILRLSKEEVLKDKIPPKTEIVVEVEYTQEQRELYRQILAKNANLLAQSRVKAQLVNVSMELRKCLCHPYLIKGFEQAVSNALPSAEAVSQASKTSKAMTERKLVTSSGKMVFLEKLIKKCYERNEKILIFSQMTKMLDIIEEFLVRWNELGCNAGFMGSRKAGALESIPYERIDGGVGSAARQKAIDRFNETPARECLVFLLSTNAGGVGVNLSSSSVVVLYDSSFNPQQDSQAQARAHRIGNRSSKVTVYRLLTRDSYEIRLFEIAKRKLELERALGGGEPGSAGGVGGAMSAEELEQLIVAGGRELAATGESEEGLSFEEMLAKHSRLVDEEGGASVEAKQQAEGDSMDFWRRLAADYAFEETSAVRKTRWQGSFAQLGAIPQAPVVAKPERQPVDERKMKIRKLEATWKSRGGEMYEKNEFEEGEKDLFISWVGKLYNIVEKSGSGSWVKRLVGLRELQFLRRMICDVVPVLDQPFSLEASFGRLSQNSVCPEFIEDMTSDETARGAISALHAIETQYGVSLLARQGVKLVEAASAEATAGAAARNRERWEQWLVERKERAVWGHPSVLEAALNAIKEIGLPVTYLQGVMKAATIGTAPWTKADWDKGCGGADMSADLRWGVEVASLDDAWAVQVEQRMRASDELRRGVQGDFGLFLTGDDICNLGRAVADVLKLVASTPARVTGTPAGTGTPAAASSAPASPEAISMDVCPPEEVATVQSSVWSLGSAVSGAVESALWQGERERVIERWRFLQLLRRDAELVVGALDSASVESTESITNRLAVGLVGNLATPELKTLLADLGGLATARRQAKQSREKEQQRAWVRKNLPKIRPFVEDALVRGGGISQSTAEKILAGSGGSVDLRKVLLPVGPANPAQSSADAGGSWRAWRALEKVVGFSASARKADAVEAKIREQMRADPKSSDVSFSGRSNDPNDAVVVSHVVEELQHAGRSDVDYDYVVFGDCEEAWKALEAVQATFMCRNLWLGGPRGSLWWQGSAAGTNFRERVEEVEKEVFLLGGDGEALLEVALNGVGMERDEAGKKRRKGEKGEVVEMMDTTVGKIEVVRQFLKAFLDKKTPKPKKPAATAASAAPAGDTGDKNTLKKWFAVVPKGDAASK